MQLFILHDLIIYYGTPAIIALISCPSHLPRESQNYIDELVIEAINFFAEFASMFQ